MRMNRYMHGAWLPTYFALTISLCSITTSFPKAMYSRLCCICACRRHGVHNVAFNPTSDKVVYKISATVMSHACNGSSLDYIATVMSLRAQHCMKLLTQSRLLRHGLLFRNTVVTFCRLLENVSHQWIGFRQ